VGYHVYLRHGTSVCWQIKTRFESGSVTADQTTTVVHSSKLLINDIKPDHSLQMEDVILELYALVLGRHERTVWGQRIILLITTLPKG